jgi:hypothetical protein
MEIPNRTFCGDLSLEFRSNQGAWLWRLVNFCDHLGIVGAAATEAEAMESAGATIDELSARCRVNDRGCDSGERATPNATE